MALESNGSLSAVCLDGVNAFGEINRDCIRAAIMANPSLHLLLPLFEMLYERGSRELFYYYENGNYIANYSSKNGVRQGCVLGAFLCCLSMQPVYSRLGALLGPEGALYAYSDDVYLLAEQVNMAVALSAVPAIYKKVGLRLSSPLVLTIGLSSHFFLKHASRLLSPASLHVLVFLATP